MDRRFFLALAAVFVLAALFFVLRPNSQAIAPQDVSFDLAIQGAGMNPPEIAANKDDKITLLVSSNRSITFHLHGYDLTSEVAPGAPATLAFDAKLTGRFVIEDEKSGRELGALIVRPRP